MKFFDVIKVQERLTCEYEQELKTKMLELEKNYQTQLDSQEKESYAILKECQTISEYNIIQSEIEKNKLTTELEAINKDLISLQGKYDESLQNYDILKTKCKNLENDLSHIVMELNETRQTLGEQLSQKEKVIQTISKQKSSYEIGINTYQTTIEVLKKRLIHSDQDVVQLKEELSNCEEKIVELESKCLQLTSDLKQSQISNDELEMQFESAIKLNRTEIEKLRNELCQKINLYKEEVEKYSNKMQKNEVDNIEISQLKNELSCLEALKAQQEFEIRRGQNELEGYHLREIDWSIKTESYEGTVKQMEDELRMKHDELRDLKMELSHLRNANDLNQRATDVEHSLNDERKSIYAKYIQISGRYDEILQKFEELQKENSDKDKIINNLSANLQEYSTIKEKCVEQDQQVKELLDKLEQLEKERKTVSF